MTIDGDLFAGITGNSGVSTLIGTRFYPLVFPHGVTFPCGTYQRISAPHEQALDRSIGEINARYQVDCYADDYDEARAVAVAVKSAALALVGSSVPVYALGIENETDTREPESGLYRSMLEIVICHGQ